MNFTIYSKIRICIIYALGKVLDIVSPCIFNMHLYPMLILALYDNILTRCFQYILYVNFNILFYACNFLCHSDRLDDIKFVINNYNIIDNSYIRLLDGTRLYSKYILHLLIMRHGIVVSGDGHKLQLGTNSVIDNINNAKLLYIEKEDRLVIDLRRNMYLSYIDFTETPLSMRRITLINME